MASFVPACYFIVKEHHKRGIHGHEVLSLESAVPIEGPELTYSPQGHLEKARKAISKVGQTALPLSTRMGRHLWMHIGTEELAEFEHIISRQDNTGQ